MTNKQSPQKRLSKIDKFGISTGLIGLLADTISLSALSSASNVAGLPSSTTLAHVGNFQIPLHIWLLVFVSMMYTIAIINFYTRRYFHKRNLQNLQPLNLLEVRQIEKGTLTFTRLIGLPLLTCYFIFALVQSPEKGGSPFDHIDLMYWLSLTFFASDLEDILPILRGLFYGGFLALYICSLLHSSILNIYETFEPSYKSTVLRNPNLPS